MVTPFDDGLLSVVADGFARAARAVDAEVTDMAKLETPTANSTHTNRRVNRSFRIRIAFSMACTVS